MISFDCLHEFLHFDVADGIVIQIDMLDAWEFPDKLCQEVKMLETLALKWEAHSSQTELRLIKCADWIVTFGCLGILWLYCHGVGWIWIDVFDPWALFNWLWILISCKTTSLWSFIPSLCIFKNTWILVFLALGISWVTIEAIHVNLATECNGAFFSMFRHHHGLSRSERFPKLGHLSLDLRVFRIQCSREFLRKSWWTTFKLTFSEGASTCYGIQLVQFYLFTCLLSHIMHLFFKIF